MQLVGEECEGGSGESRERLFCGLELFTEAINFAWF